MKAGDAISLIESAYRLDLSNEKWLEQIAETATTAFGSNHGAMAFRYDASGGDWVHVETAAVHGLSPQFAQDFLNQPDTPPEAAQVMAQQFKSARFHALRTLIDGGKLPGLFGAVLDRHGIDDLICINGLDPSGRGCMLTIIDRRKSHPPRAVHLWHRLAAHVSAGNRLRATLDALAPDGLASPERAEAILTPNGKVEHATGPAESRSSRDALRDALVRIDAARSERADERRSVELWRALVAGRWSLVEHFERDGKRYYLAHKNDPELIQDRALTRRERQVLGYAELGNSNKLIGYSLGLSRSTVGTILGRARRKLGNNSDGSGP